MRQISLFINLTGFCLPAQEMRVPSLGQEDPLEDMATHSSILAWRIPRTEEPGGLQFIELESDTS